MPDPNHTWGLFWATVLGAAIGVVAGTIIQYFLTRLLDRAARARQKNALTKEMGYNRSLVAELAEEMERFRNAVNGRVFGTYFGYFHIGKALFIQANASASNGFLYDLLDTDDVRHLQRVVVGLSANSETWFNGEITRRRNILLNTPDQFDHTELVQFMEFVATHVRELERLIDLLLRKLRGG